MPCFTNSFVGLKEIITTKKINMMADDSGWLSASECIPKGEYRLRVVFTLGKTYIHRVHYTF